MFRHYAAHDFNPQRYFLLNGPVQSDGLSRSRQQKNEPSPSNVLGETT